MAYYINLFTPETWREIRENADWAVTGHTPRILSRASIVPGDVFLCWITGRSSIVGALEVTGDVFEVGADGPRIWRKELFPVRYPVKLVSRVALDDGVTLEDIRSRTEDPKFWTWAFRNSGNQVSDAEAQWILSELRDRPQLPASASEPGVSAPPPAADVDGAEEATSRRSRRDTGHSRAQLQLARLAERSGLDVWIARNDRSASVDGVRLGDLSLDALPRGLPADAERVIGLIDVLWLRRNNYVAAFEIEASTPIYSGLTRMGDLVALMPNFRIDLFIVAPESKRDRVFQEITRPLFQLGLDPPLETRCRFIALERLAEAFEHYGTAVDATRLLDELAEEAS